MKLINWIKSLFNKQALEPVSFDWVDMAKKQKGKPVVVQMGIHKSSSKIARGSVKPVTAPLQNSVDTTYPHYLWVPEYYGSGVTQKEECTSKYSSSFSDDSPSKYSCGSSSSDSYSGGGGSFDGGGSSDSGSSGGSDW